MGKCYRCRYYICKCNVQIIWVICDKYNDDNVEFAVDTEDKAIEYIENHSGYTYREIELR